MAAFLTSWVFMGITLTQRKYALDLLHRAYMENYRATSTPMSVTEKLAKDLGKPLTADDVSNLVRWDTRSQQPWT